MSTNTYAMRLLEERHMGTKVDLMVWSQKMDLLAISNSKGEVALHRLSWQKVWSLSPPSDGVLATGIAWRPDSKVIAVAYSNNELYLINVENKDIIDKRTYNSASEESESSGSDAPRISYLGWLEERGHDSSNYEASQNVACYYLPPLPPISRTFGSITEENNEVYEDIKKTEDQHELNLLAVGLSGETLRIDLTVFGLFGVGTLTIPNMKSDRVVAVDSAADFSRLFVLVVSATGEFRLIVFNTSIITQYSAEIHTLGCEYGQIMSLLDYLENTMQAITEACENMLLSEMESKLSQYADSMPRGSVSADLLELLMFGVASDTLEAFLVKELTNKGIKKLSLSMELSHSNIQKLILKHLQPVAQKIAYHLTDLRGMARFTERFQVLGLQKDEVSESFKEVGSFLVKSSEVIGVTDVSSKKYKALFQWIYHVIKSLVEEGYSLPGISEQDTAFIADYLYNLEGNAEEDADLDPESFLGKCRTKKRCYLDLLGQYIADAELPDPVPLESNPWEKFLVENPCFFNHPSIIPRHPNLSLVQQHRRLKNAIASVFDRPRTVIGQKIKVEGVINLLSATVPQPRVSMRYVDSSRHLAIATIPEPNSSYLTFVNVDITEPTISSVDRVNLYFKSMDINSGYTTVDLQLFNDTALSVLLSEPADGAAVFAQLQLKRISEAARSDAITNVMKPIEKEGEKFIDGFLLADCRMKSLDNMRASRLAVSGGRKVAVILSQNTHKVRTYEMEVEEDEEEEELETSRSCPDT